MRKSIFPKFYFKKLFLRLGAERISRKALERFTFIVEEKMKELASEAYFLARHAGRKTVLHSDIIIAKKRCFE